MKIGKNRYYSLNKILATKSHYNIVIGERSNGKTYAVLKYGLEQYFKNGSEMGIIRRYSESLRGKRAASVFNALVDNNEVKRLSGGEWTGVYYFGSRWYLSRTDENGKMVRSDTPFAYAFSLSTMEHDKSTSFPNIKVIMFDEFTTRETYLVDEFILFQNTLSTIIRDRDNVVIFMLGNTVNKYSPYFKEMGLTNIKKMTPGTIDVYKYGESELKVAVEFTDKAVTEKKSNVYFAFDNPKLNMITGKGNVWEMDIYPHLPVKYFQNDVLFTYFIIFDGETLQCEIINKMGIMFTYIHRKTTPIRNPDTDLIYSIENDYRPNYRRNILKANTSLEKKIIYFFHIEKVFYQDNEVGEIVRNYISWCRRQ